MKSGFVERTLAGLIAASDYAASAEQLAAARGALQAIDPRVKVAGLFALVLAAAAARNLPTVAGLFVSALLLAGISRIRFQRLAGWVWTPVLFFTGTIALPAVFLTPGRALAAWGPVAIAAPGLDSAALLVARAETAATLSALLVLTTPWPWVLKSLRVFRARSWWRHSGHDLPLHFRDSGNRARHVRVAQEPHRGIAGARRTPPAGRPPSACSSVRACNSAPTSTWPCSPAAFAARSTCWTISAPAPPIGCWLRRFRPPRRRRPVVGTMTAPEHRRSQLRSSTSKACPIATTRSPPSTDVSLAIPAGKRVALLGANGSGKSTLLRLLDGLYFPDSGAISFHGQPLASERLEDDRFAFDFRRRVGLVFQNPDVQLFNPTVFDEVAFAPLQLRWPKRRDRPPRCRRARPDGDRPSANRPPHRLSGGEKKRVALASVLVLDPEVLLLDEPTAALDPRSQSQIIDLLIGWGDGRKTVITATHDLGLVEDIADYCFLLQHGKLVAAEGEPGAVLRDQALLESSNLIHAHRHRHADGGFTHSHPHTHPHSHPQGHD